MRVSVLLKDRKVRISILVALTFVVILILGQIIFDSSFLQDFSSNGLSTMLGIVIGIPIALWLSGFQERRTEKERKTIILKSLREEINKNWINIKIWLDEKPFSDEIFNLSLNLRDEIWRSFSNGSELKWIKDPRLLAELSDAYYIIRAIRESSEKYFQSTFHAGRSQGNIYCKQLELIIKGQLEEARKIISNTFSAIDANL